MPAKKCNNCNEIKSVEDFNKNVAVSDGYDRTCRECIKIIAKATRERRKQNVASKGNGRRRSKLQPEDQRRQSPPITPADTLYLDPAAIRAIKRGVARELIPDMIFLVKKFLEERFA